MHGVRTGAVADEGEEASVRRLGCHGLVAGTERLGEARPASPPQPESRPASEEAEMSYPLVADLSVMLRPLSAAAALNEVRGPADGLTRSPPPSRRSEKVSPSRNRPMSEEAG